MIKYKVAVGGRVVAEIVPGVGVVGLGGGVESVFLSAGFFVPVLPC